MFSVYQVQIQRKTIPKDIFTTLFSKTENSQDNSLLAQRVEVMTTAEV